MCESSEIDIPRSSEAITIRWQGVLATLSFAAPIVSSTEGDPPTVGHANTADGWIHEQREETPRTFVGVAGRQYRDSFSNGVLRVAREVWVAGAPEQLMAIRQTVTNLREHALLLDELRPLHLDGPDALAIDALAAGRWEVLRQGRMKNAIPAAVRLGVYDDDYAHATFVDVDYDGTQRRLSESGSPPTDAAGRSVRLEIDSFAVIRGDDEASRTHLLIGFLSQTDHLAQIELETDAQRRVLSRLTAHCLFDGCQLPPGGERTSQWVMLSRGESPHDLIGRFAEHVGRYHGVPRPYKAPPAVWCSWYYYGPDFYEEQLHAELKSLAVNRVPFDVLLIDDSRRPWGDWYSNHRWPSGMKDAADRIKALGYVAGLWTCPFLASTGSRFVRDHPHWLLRQRDGQPVLFGPEGIHYVLDPTYPGVAQHLEDLFRVMTCDWGFTYHKLDFVRTVFMNPQARFHDSSATRLEAYRRGLEAVRRGTGPDAYLSVCGGHYGGSLGLANSQRSGADVRGCWNDPPALPKIKQNLLRTWMNRFWHTDADALMIRRRAEPASQGSHGWLSLGRFTDDEAFTLAVNQYVGGGILCATECFADIDKDRLGLYRHVVPVASSEAVALDLFRPQAPSQMLNRIVPRCDALGRWVTLAVFNWQSKPAEQVVELSGQVVKGMEAQRYLVFEFATQEVLGLFDAGTRVAVSDIPPHGCRVLRVIPWRGDRAVLAGTNLHVSGGGVEVTSWTATERHAAGMIETRWAHPVIVTVAFPDKHFCAVRSVRSADDGSFAVTVSTGGPDRRCT